MSGTFTPKPQFMPKDEAALNAARPWSTRGVNVETTVSTIRLDTVDHGAVVAVRSTNVGYPAITITVTCEEGGELVHRFTWSARQVRLFAEALLEMARDVERA